MQFSNSSRPNTCCFSSVFSKRKGKGIQTSHVLKISFNLVFSAKESKFQIKWGSIAIGKGEQKP